MRALLAIVALGLAAALLGALGQPSTTRPGRGDRSEHPSQPIPAATPAPRRLSPREDRAQTRPDREQTRAEQRTFDSRPLLRRLPLERAGVRIDLAGLAADDRHAVLAIDPGERSRSHARRVLARALRRAGDEGSAYRLEWTR